LIRILDVPLLLASGCDIEKYWLVSATPERNVRSSEAEAEVLVEDSRTKAKRKDDTMLFQEDRKRGKREDERGEGEFGELTNFDVSTDTLRAVASFRERKRQKLERSNLTQELPWLVVMHNTHLF
jgi:hypothetical protein